MIFKAGYLWRASWHWETYADQDGAERDTVEFRITSDSAAQLSFRDILPDQNLNPLILKKQ